MKQYPAARRLPNELDSRPRFLPVLERSLGESKPGASPDRGTHFWREVNRDEIKMTPASPCARSTAVHSMYRRNSGQRAFPPLSANRESGILNK